MGTIIGLDILEMARMASERDRPGLYEDYIVGDMATPGLIQSLIERYSLNAITCAGALSHLPIDDFTHKVWEIFPKGTWLSGALYEVPGTENEALAAYKKTGLFEFISCEQFVHRQSMAGEPIYNLALLARRS